MKKGDRVVKPGVNPAYQDRGALIRHGKYAVIELKRDNGFIKVYVCNVTNRDFEFTFSITETKK